MTNSENSTTTSESLMACNGASSPVKPVQVGPPPQKQAEVMDSGGLVPTSENSNLDDIDEDNEGSEQGSSDGVLLSSASNTNNDSSNEENERSNEKKRVSSLHSFTLHRWSRDDVHEVARTVEYLLVERHFLIITSRPRRKGLPFSNTLKGHKSSKM